MPPEPRTIRRALDLSSRPPRLRLVRSLPTLFVVLIFVSYVCAGSNNGPTAHTGGLGPPKTFEQPSYPLPRTIVEPQPSLATASQEMHLLIPILRADAPIVPVGILPGGGLDVPTDPQILGWWRNGAAPGSAVGAVVIDGHVDPESRGRAPSSIWRTCPPTRSLHSMRGNGPSGTPCDRSDLIRRSTCRSRRSADPER